MSNNEGDFNYSPLLTLVCSSQVLQASPIVASPSGATYVAHSSGSLLAFQTSDKPKKACRGLKYSRLFFSERQ
jgi:hypothetical protein